jgi:hypothetical protein
MTQKTDIEEGNCKSQTAFLASYVAFLQRIITTFAVRMNARQSLTVPVLVELEEAPTDLMPLR